jgi:pimeloyl-ACP methyl ester carboxylesterase
MHADKDTIAIPTEPTNPSLNSSSKPLVVLIHGIASGRFTMWPLAWRLRRTKFPTRCFGYASLFYDIERHGQRFRDFLEKEHLQSPGRKIHIVAHSMGGVVTRRALTPDCPDFIHRVVMLGTPQQGSRSATWLAQHGLGLIKSLGQVSHEPDSFVNQMPAIRGPEIGTIAASYDFVIPRPSSHVEGEREYVCAFSGHNGLLVRPKVGKLVTRFLEHGTFSG